MYGGELDVSWEGGLEGSGWMQGGLRRDWTGVWPGEVVPVGRLNKKGINQSKDTLNIIPTYYIKTKFACLCYSQKKVLILRTETRQHYLITPKLIVKI